MGSRSQDEAVLRLEGNRTPYVGHAADLLLCRRWEARGWQYSYLVLFSHHKMYGLIVLQSSTAQQQTIVLYNP
jgi:hypothetical protein